MSLIDQFKFWFKKGETAVGLGKTLGRLTDDPRIAMTAKDYERILFELQYYRDDNQRVQMRNSNGISKKRSKHTVSIVRQACRAWASLIFDEKATINVSYDNQKDNDDLNDYIHDVLKGNDFNDLYEEYLETGIAAGGFAICPQVIDGEIKLSWVRPDQFYPMEANTSRINSAAVVTQTTASDGMGGTEYYSLVTFHEFSEAAHTIKITNELYKSNDSKTLGKNISLKAYAPYADLDNSYTLENMRVPLIAYFKTPGRNNINLESNLGVGIVRNSRYVIDDLNTANDMLQRELVLSRRRVIVSKEAIKPVNDPSTTEGERQYGTYFDDDDDTFMGIPGSNDGDPNGPFVKQLESNIQVDKYNEAIQSYLRRFENQIGLSQGTLSIDSKQGDKTATEVVSDNSMTYRTRSSYCTQAEKQIKWLIMAIIELSMNPAYGILDERLSGLDVIESDIHIDVSFKDGVFTDSETKQTNDLNLVSNQIMSKKTFLVNNLGYTEEEAVAELKAVQDEAGNLDPLPDAQKSLFGDDDTATGD